MPSIAEARYAGGHRIELRFDTGEQGLVDLFELIQRYTAAAPLLDPELFAAFELDDWPTLAWTCGFDVAPETLYELATGKRPVWATT